MSLINNKAFLPIYRTYYEYTAPTYETDKVTKEVIRAQAKEVVHEVTLYDNKGNLVTTKLR